MSSVITSCTLQVLHTFGKVLNYLQNVDALEAFSFNHTPVKFVPNMEKYLQGLISSLEEIKDILDALYQEQSKLQQTKSDYVSSLDIQDQSIKPSHSESVITIEQHNTATVEALKELQSSLSGENFQLSSVDHGNGYIGLDAPIAPMTPASQLISSAIDSLVQHDPEEKEPLVIEHSGNASNNNVGCESIPLDNKDVAEREEEIKEMGEKEGFRCDVCGKFMSSKQSLQQHASVHSSVKRYCCEHCGKLFTKGTNLAAHLTRQHNLNTESAHSCSECGKLFVRKSALETHLAGHRGDKPFSCFVCEKSFTQKVTRDTHQLIHTREYPFSCDVCSNRFTTKAKLKFHKKKHEELEFTCNVCSKQFSTRQYLNAHLQTQHNIKHAQAAPCCLDTVSKDRRAQVEIDESRVTCPQCDLTFKSRRALTRHTMTKHNPLAPWYHCTVTDCKRPVKSFATKSQLNKHNRRHHSENPTKFACMACDRVFADKLSLIHHDKQKHMVGLTVSQLRPHACHLCPKRFSFKSRLTSHVRTHTEEPRYTCDLCPKSFHRVDSLNRHRKLHRSIGENPPPVTSVPSLPCTRCGKVFRSKNALLYHQMTHEGKFQFMCQICGKEFVRKCHYEGHLKSHSSERPFKCTTCGRTFKDRKHWREHIRRVHPATGLTMQSLLDAIAIEENDHAHTSQPLPHDHPYHLPSIPENFLSLKPLTDQDKQVLPQ